MDQIDAFPEMKPDATFCDQKKKDTLLAKIKASQQTTKHLKKLLKQYTRMCDKQIEIEKVCSDD